MIDFLKNLNLWQAAGWFLLENSLIVVGVVQIGNEFRRQFAHRNLDALSDNATWQEWLLVLGSVMVNTGVTTGGYWLWLQGWIRFDERVSYRIVTDFLVLIVVMDMLMFFLHLLVHRTFIYKLTHHFHHRFTQPEPIDLFILDPFETIAFGGLWLLVLVVFQANLLAVVGYLVANTLFGMLGHVGVEPFPAGWVRHPLLKFITTSTFHYQHHNNERCNFGFYTTCWDTLFNTLDPEYTSRFEQTAQKTTR